MSSEAALTPRPSPSSVSDGPRLRSPTSRSPSGRPRCPVRLQDLEVDQPNAGPVPVPGHGRPGCASAPHLWSKVPEEGRHNTHGPTQMTSQCRTPKPQSYQACHLHPRNETNRQSGIAATTGQHSKACLSTALPRGRRTPRAPAASDCSPSPHILLRPPTRREWCSHSSLDAQRAFIKCHWVFKRSSECPCGSVLRGTESGGRAGDT